MKTYLTLACLVVCSTVSAQNYTSYFTGNETDAEVEPEFGICMMGGATESNEGMIWLLEKANGGDVVVLRATGSDGYNDYLYSELGVPVNSVETLVLPSLEAANNPVVAERLARAEVIWIAGGDQYDYVQFWKGTPVEDAINDLINIRGGAVGGTSAGMAILGNVYFSAQNGSVLSQTALQNPTTNQIALGYNDFLEIPLLQNVVTDTHYNDPDLNPDRKGRHVAFMARAMTDFGIEPLGIACNEYTAFCLDENGVGTAFGEYDLNPTYEDFVYIIRPRCPEPLAPEVLTSDQPLTWNHNGTALEVIRLAGTTAGTSTIDLNTFTAQNAAYARWWVEAGELNEDDADAFSCVLSVADATQADALYAYPNPSRGSVMLQGLTPSQLVEVVDITGKRVAAEVPTTNKLELSLEQFPAGLYVLRHGSAAVRVFKAE